MRVVSVLVILSGCTEPVSSDRLEGSGPPVADVPPDSSETDTLDSGDTDPEPDTITGGGEGGSAEAGAWLFDESLVHEVTLTIDQTSWSALLNDPREYAPVTISIGENADLSVAIKLKGNTQFRPINQKPSMVIDFNRVVKEQEVDGLSSVYLHNMIYDPSMMHEHFAYRFFRTVGVPASRTAYAHVTLNGIDYGLFLFVEKQNKVYRERWWSDADGSMFEAGSFNWSCDLDQDCTCYEVDELAKGGEDALLELCDAVSTESEDWLEAAREHLSWEQFIDATAAEMVISHYDNYGWNINNYRLYHDPSADKWSFTPWSTDLSFGWYPWSGNPHCGEYGQLPREYNGGYLIRRCWGNAECAAELQSSILEQATVLESMGMVEQIDTTYAMIDDYILTDTRREYSNWWVEQEVECMRDWVAGRPAFLQ